MSLSASSSQTVTVAYATSNVTAIAGSDFAGTSGTVTFSPGQTSRTVSVTVNGDTTIEPDETFVVNLSSPVNAMISDNQATGTILNDDVPSVSIGNVSSTEGNSGTKTFTFPVSLSASSGQTVTVAYATSNGTASSGSDYSGTSGTLTFSPGQTSRTVNVTVNGDTGVEPDETFVVNLSSPVNATLSDAQATGTIQNDDAPPPAGLPVIIDDGGSGFSDIGFVRVVNGGHWNDYKYGGVGIGSSATWRFTGLTPGARYNVSTTWLPHANRATDAPYRINGSAPVRVNQELTPQADFTDARKPFQSLGTFTANGSGVLQVVLGVDANQYVIADAVRVQAAVDSVFADDPSIGLPYE